MTSYHYTNERQEREAIIKKIGYGKIIKTAIVDDGHPKGATIHEISDTGIITITNQKTHKLVTRLIARPYQIRRYWDNGNAPWELVKIAIKHQQMGYNLI